MRAKIVRFLLGQAVYRVNHKNAIIGWELYFKNKKNLEQIMSISRLVMNLPLQW